MKRLKVTGLNLQSRSVEGGERGQMLIIVLWVIGLLSVAIGTVTVRSTHEVRLGRIPMDVLRRNAITQAGIQQAVRVIAQDTTESPQLDTLQEPWATGRNADGTALFEHVSVGDGTFSVGQTEGATFAPGLIDEERHLNIRVASVDQLRHLIEHVAVTGVDAQTVAAAIVDWRDEPIGPACQGAMPPCHNGLFDSVEELRLVPGLSPELFAALEPYVTIYGSGMVNVNTASAIVLDAMGDPGEQLVEQRKAQPFQSYPGLAVTSTVFMVPVEARLTDDATPLRVRAVVDRHGAVLAWVPHPSP